MKKLASFVAYPAQPSELSEPIEKAVESANARGKYLTYTTWKEDDIAGRPLATPILTKIRDSALLVADITRLNFNVTYEIGYAIGMGKRAYLIRNRTFAPQSEKIRSVGIFDTLGYSDYENSDHLADLLTIDIDLTPLKVASPLNRKAPVYVIETPHRTEAMGRIIARAKKGKLFYRSFIPSEEFRMSAPETIEHVTSSYGVIVPLLSPEMDGAEIHNIRAAFVAGLTHGMERIILIMQPHESIVPLDIRDFCEQYKYINDIDEHMQDFGLKVFESIQQTEEISIPRGGLLDNLRVGDPMAENEFQDLAKYYLRTDQFNRAKNGDVNLVVGRKGSGKTALFFQLRDYVRAQPHTVVVDLKPEGYQLIKLKEDVMDYLNAGAQQHLITAFWEYLLLLEVCYKILENDSRRYLRDHRLYDKYLALKYLFESDAEYAQADFSERLHRLSNDMIQNYQMMGGPDLGSRLDYDQITQMLHRHDISELFMKVSEYIQLKSGVWVLFDNLDKGWSTHGIAQGDLAIIRGLIDAGKKLQRDMRRKGHDFYSIAFLRNDVYELLMRETPDYGKEMRASLDWSDPDLLRELMRRRLIENDLPRDADFLQLWGHVCISHYQGEESSEFMIRCSLMRPRNFLKLFSHCKGFAVNFEHVKIEMEDMTKGLESYSNDLIIDADLEMRDVEPAGEDLIYKFLGEKAEYTLNELKEIFSRHELSDEKSAEILNFLLYYGFLGVIEPPEEAIYIYHLGYDIKKMQAMVDKKKGPDLRFQLNPAFWPGLGIVA